MLAAGTENSVYLNPRAWDAVLRIETIAQSADAGARAFARLWQRFEALALGVRLQEGIVAELIVRYDGAGLPPTWRRFVEQTAPPRDIWERTPGDALLAFAGPNDLALLGSALAAWAPPGKNRDWDRLRQVARGLLLGRDLFDDVLPKLESCGAYVVARPNREAPGQPPPGLPLEALAVFTLPSSTATADDPSAVPDLRASLENALNTGLNVLAAAQNAKGSETVAAVRTSEREGLRLRWIEGAGPHQPAYGLTATHLILASSPQLIRDFEQPPRAPSPSYEHVAQQYFAGENQVLFVNLARISQFLGDQRESLTRQTAASHGVSEPEAAQRLQRINELLQLLDAGFIAGHLHEDSLRIVVGGVVVPPAAR
jgi:hypothetical protein